MKTLIRSSDPPNAVRALLARVNRDDVIEFASDFVFDAGGGYVPFDCRVEGNGYRLVNSQPFSDGKKTFGASFELGNCDVRDVTLVNDRAPDGRQAIVCGFTTVRQQVYDAVLRRVNLIGTDWCGYSWAANGNRLRWYGGDILGGLNGITAGNSGGNFGQYFELHDLRIVLTPDKAETGDLLRGGGCLGIATRGGTVRSYGCSIEIVVTERYRQAARGPIPRAVCVTDNFMGERKVEGSENSVSEHYRLTTKITAPADLPCFDASGRIAKLALFGGGRADGKPWAIDGEKVRIAA